MQSVITAGITLDYLTTVTLYPPADGWTLNYYLTPVSAAIGSNITFAADVDGTDYRSQVGPDVTAAWAPGAYCWSAKVEKPGAAYLVDSGTLTIRPDPATVAAGTDMRSPARKALAAINDGLASLGSQAHIAEYSINGRSMRFETRGALLAMRSQLEWEVKYEDSNEAMRAGMPNPRQIRVRMARA